MLNNKQLRTIAEFEARAASLGHEFSAYPDGRMVAQNAYGERMTWQVMPDTGKALVIDDDDELEA
jgi:hypothetical protein